MKIHLDGILIVTINISMDCLLMVHTAFRSTIRSLLEFSIPRIFFHSVKLLYYYSLGYEPVKKKYKVLMQVHNSSEHVQNFIFTLSTDKSWRKLKRYH
ncbi:hypothetical protein H5410_060689 [Solanum commersonii]|uniref:F-box associated beta-propeller type 3 domain-containing protein n=1 Tax=Solanum commersonii TaxID=4109 RepID=A0A9J5W5Q3_SOLCO|nr:hypothetical protein H5410_060689 [Solanum commersonii]